MYTARIILFNAEDLLCTIGVGAVNGALGDVAGLVEGLFVKGILCAAVGGIAGIYAGISTDGSLGEKLAVGASTAAIAAAFTYAGTGIDTNHLSAGNTAFATFSGAMAISVPAEIAAVGSQQLIHRAYQKNSTSAVTRGAAPGASRARPHNYVTVLMGREVI